MIVKYVSIEEFDGLIEAHPQKFRYCNLTPDLREITKQLNGYPRMFCIDGILYVEEDHKE